MGFNYPTSLKERCSENCVIVFYVIICCTHMSISFSKLVLVLMNRYYCAATQAYVKASLVFKLALAIQKRGLKRLPRNVDSIDAIPFRFVLIVTRFAAGFLLKFKLLL